MNNRPLANSRILIGKILGAHGVRGAMRMASFAESLSIFQPGTQIVVEGPRGRVMHEIDWVKPHSRGALLALKGIKRREEAEELRGAEMYIEKAALPALEADTYYWDDLIGLEVITKTGRKLGRLESIIATGSHDVYVVRNRQQEVLVPALASVVLAVELEENRMTVDLPEGLL